MFLDIHYLLVGNSRLHWAKNSQNQYIFFHTRKDYKPPNNINLDNLIWASVGHSPNFLLKAKNQIITKDINLPNLPDFFGVDRAFAGLAALNYVINPLKKNLLIADFGTILSITKFSSDGSIIGGQLAPGFMTQLKSIEYYTKNLKVPTKYKIPPDNFLINTEDAILRGVLNNLIGLINLSFNPSEDILITCGGDSELITKSLNLKNKEVINKPNLVMEGMIIHFQSSQKNYFNPRSAII